MNKHELKSLLENIYEAMILPTLGDQALSNPGLLNPPLQTTPTPQRPVTPPPPPPPPIDIKPQPGDDPAIIEEINNILNILQFLLNLSVEHQDGVEALRARLQELIRQLVRQRNLGGPRPNDGGAIS